MGGALGKSSILIYDNRVEGVQEAAVDMIVVSGDDIDASQLVVTLHPPRVIPLAFDVVTSELNQQNLTGEQTNREVTTCDFPGTKSPVRWPPLEAIFEFGTGGVNTKVYVDYLNGVTVSVCASYLRVRAAISQGRCDDDVVGTSAAYYLAANVAPGFAAAHAQRTISVGAVKDHDDSDVFETPLFANIAALIGRMAHKYDKPTLTIGWIRFWQSPNGTHGVGDFFVSNHQDRIKVPNGAMYFSVYNESGHKMKMSVIFELAL